MLSDQICLIIENKKGKTLLEVGAHDDSLTIELAKHFKKVYNYYEFLKIPDRAEKNIVIKKIPYKEILEHLDEYEVVLMENEFHHFPDILQMWTYKKLVKGQILLIVEWNKKGNYNDYYKCFQNCSPLRDLTHEILSKFISEKIIKVTREVEGKYEDTINSKQEMIDYYKFMFPDHWEFGGKQFLEKIKNIKYPIKIWDGYTMYQIEKL